MELNTVNNGWIAFIAGVITSPHCIVMCGPLAFVVLQPKNNTSISKYSSQLIYHISRIFMFTLFGTLAGILGMGLIHIFQFSLIKYFPWILVVFLGLFALGIDKVIPKVPLAQRFFSRATQRITHFSINKRGLLLGLATPFLPCTPLYMIFWVALLSGTPLFGAEIAFGFGIGTFPLMMLAGSQYFRLHRLLTPKTIYYIQRIMASIASFLLAWRLLASESPMQVHSCCPF